MKINYTYKYSNISTVVQFFPNSWQHKLFQLMFLFSQTKFLKQITIESRGFSSKLHADQTVHVRTQKSLTEPREDVLNRVEFQVMLAGRRSSGLYCRGTRRGVVSRGNDLWLWGPGRAPFTTGLVLFFFRCLSLPLLPSATDWTSLVSMRFQLAYLRDTCKIKTFESSYDAFAG